MLPSFVKRPEQAWLLWNQAKAYSVLPSDLLGIDRGSYTAYCLNEALYVFGMTLENKLDSAGQKPGKEDRKIKAARDQVMKNMFDPEKKKGSGFADPALMFK